MTIIILIAIYCNSIVSSINRNTIDGIFDQSTNQYILQYIAIYCTMYCNTIYCSLSLFHIDISRINATGVPPYVNLANRFWSLEKTVGSLSSDMKEMNATLPDSLCQKMLDNFTVNGAVPVTSTYLDSLRDNFSRN